MNEPLQKVFKTIDSAATATKVRWRALYTDFDAAKEANKNLRRNEVGFQWEHGPAPFVLHVHLDIMPLRWQMEPLLPDRRARGTGHLRAGGQARQVAQVLGRW